LLRLFADIRDGEVGTALLLMLNVFLLFTAYYILKPTREALILQGGSTEIFGWTVGKAQIKSYASAGMALLLIFVVQWYGRLASAVPRQKLITFVTLFFISNLVVFYMLVKAAVTVWLGIAFFIWIGIFNNMVVSQFWAFANDLYVPEQGKRLFPIVGFGASSGAVGGSWIAHQLIALGEAQMLLCGAIILTLCIVLTNVVHRREAGKRAAMAALLPAAKQVAVVQASEAEKPVGRSGGFQLVFFAALSAVDRPPGPGRQHRQLDRRVHPEQQGRGCGGGSRRFRHRGGLERGPVDRPLLFRLCVVDQHPDRGAAAVHRVADSEIRRSASGFVHPAAGRAGRLHGPGIRRCDRPGAYRQDRRERHRLFGAEHHQALAVPADASRSKIQGESGRSTRSSCASAISYRRWWCSWARRWRSPSSSSRSSTSAWSCCGSCSRSGWLGSTVRSPNPRRMQRRPRLPEGSMEFALDDAVRVLRRTPAVLDALLRDLPADWLAANEGPGTWSPFDIVGHLVHGERTDWMPRLSMILDHGESRSFEPFDRFAMLQSSSGKSLAELLDAFAALRAANLDKLAARRLQREDLQRRGRHPELGTVTLSELLATWVAHDLEHLAQIARVMGREYTTAVGPWRAYLPMLQRPAEDR
jgi:uncharacterized damage-inducible protein DinB